MKYSPREKLLRKKDLAIVSEVEYCKAEELAESENKAWAKENKIESVSSIKVQKGRKKMPVLQLVARAKNVFATRKDMQQLHGAQSLRRLLYGQTSSC